MRNRKFQKMSKKIQKKLKNTIVASFHAKIGWKRLRKIENKKLSFRYVLTRCVIENYKKKSKKIQKYHYGFIRSQNRLKKRMRKRENKDYHSVPTRLLIENSKNIQKIKKIPL